MLKKENKIKKGLFIFLFAIMLLPGLQQNFPFITSGKLYGYFAEAPYAEFSWPKWWDGSYRDETNKYLNDNVGFRPDLLRANNQLEYSLFQKLHATWLAPGKDHYLFQTHHINAYYGRDFIGYAAIVDKMVKYKAINDTLARSGKLMVLIHSPCKAFFYPEYLPENLKSPQRKPTNFETYVHVADSLGISQVNFNSWFVSLKQTTKELLFTKQGIHWSVYGSLLAADSLVKYIEKHRNIHVPHLVWTKIVHTTTARGPDDDLAKTLNLIYPTVTETFSYPEVTYPEDASKVKPKAIYIGDSFLETWINDGLMEHTNAEWQVWNHFSTIRDRNYAEGQPQRDIAGYDWINAIKNTDCIVIMYTSFNMNEFGDGFIEKAYEYFYPKK